MSTEYPGWNPYQTFTWTAAQVVSWIDANGESAFYDGRLWRIVAKKIFNNRYQVRFEER